MARKRSQQGAALMLFLTVLVIGIAWYAVGALSKAGPGTAEREIRTGHALQAAKQALLAYVAHRAADSGESYPGRLPCPESPGQVGTGAEGQAAPIVSPSFPTCSTLGRLPWRTLGIDQLRDGHGEPLWYAAPLGTWALVNSSTVLNINPGLANQLTFDGQANAVVAAIIAPGSPLNTATLPGPPPSGCTGVNQQTNRYAVPYDPTKFLECGNEAASYITAGPAPWSNDRAITITAAEVMEAIAGAVADRVQRQVMPALAGWNQLELTTTGKSWSSPFLPFAPSFSDPATNGYCGTAGVREGLAPLASRASAACNTDWTAVPSSVLGLAFTGCTTFAAYVECQFLRAFVTTPISATIVATSQKAAGSFRGPIVASDVAYIGTAPASTSFSLTISETTGNATATVSATWPLSIAPFAVVSIRIPHLPDAAVLNDPRVTWFRNNNWHRYAYYAVAPSATLNSTTPCSTVGDPGCVEVRGLPTSTGNYWNKRLAMVMAGMPLAGQSRSCATDVNSNSIPDCAEALHYFEEQNASTLDRIYRADLRIPNPSAPTPPYPAFNDRVAACPMQYATDSGSVTVCN